jgi:hypothetical protein
MSEVFTKIFVYFAPMKKISPKLQRFLVFVAKIAIVIGAFWFIYQQLARNSDLKWDKFLVLIKQKWSVGFVIFMLFLSFLNRFLEILKWQNLVSSFQKISIFVATKQVLASLTAGIFTPNGLGEYAGKAFYFPKTETKRIVLLNLVCNGIQMIYSVLFGILGFVILGYYRWSLTAVLAGIIFILVLFSLKKIKIKGYSISMLLDKINEIPFKIRNKNIYLALLRYATFSHQYYFLFLGFGVNLPYFNVIATIFIVYFLSSSLPTFQFLDFAVKGSVAVYFFNFLGVNQWIVVSVTSLVWFLNVVIPVFLGSFFVLNFKPNKT